MRKKRVLILPRGSDEDGFVVEKEIKEKKSGASKRSVLTGLSQASTIGFAISLPLVGGAILGRYLDTQFGSGPKLTLLLLFVGLIIGVSGMYRVIKEVEK